MIHACDALFDCIIDKLQDMVVHKGCPQYKALKWQGLVETAKALPQHLRKMVLYNIQPSISCFVGKQREATIQNISPTMCRHDSITSSQSKHQSLSTKSYKHSCSIFFLGTSLKDKTKDIQFVPFKILPLNSFKQAINLE